VSQAAHDLFNRLLHTVGSALRIGRKTLKELANRLTQQAANDHHQSLCQAMLNLAALVGILKRKEDLIEALGSRG
jgi:hypothetical protein